MTKRLRLLYVEDKNHHLKSPIPVPSEFDQWTFSCTKSIAFIIFRPIAREAALNDFIVKPKKQNTHNRHHSHRQPTTNVNDNELVREMHHKLKGRHLRDVVIDGANIGRT